MLYSYREKVTICGLVDVLNPRIENKLNRIRKSQKRLGPQIRHIRRRSANLHCKKELAVFPSPAGMSLIKLFLGGNNLVFSRPERVWSVTSRLGTGKCLTLFYSVTSYFSLISGLYLYTVVYPMCV
jgi:hypothetical protein